MSPPADQDEPGTANGSRRRPVSFIALDPYWLRRGAVGVLLLVVVLFIGEWIFDKIASFLFLLLLAWLLGIAMDPIVGWLARHGIKRGLAAFIVLIGFVLGFLGFLAAFGGLFVVQLEQLIESAPNAITEGTKWLNDTFHTDLNASEITSKLNISPQQIATIASQLAGGVLGVLSAVLGIFFQALTMLLFAFYFAADGPRVRNVIASWLPESKQRVFVTVWDIAVRKTGGFVVSRLLLAILSAAVTAGFLWAIDVPYWLPLGLWTGVVSQFIPTIGTYLGIALPAFVALFNDPLDVIWIIIFGTVYQQIENYFFSPRISSKTMDIHPAVAFGSVIIGAALFGPLGALIGIPLAAMVLAVLETYGKRYELAPNLRPGPADEAAAAEGDDAVASESQPS